MSSKVAVPLSDCTTTHSTWPHLTNTEFLLNNANQMLQSRLEPPRKTDRVIIRHIWLSNIKYKHCSSNRAMSRELVGEYKLIECNYYQMLSYCIAIIANDDHSKYFIYILLNALYGGSTVPKVSIVLSLRCANCFELALKNAHILSLGKTIHGRQNVSCNLRLPFPVSFQ